MGTQTIYGRKHPQKHDCSYFEHVREDSVVKTFPRNSFMGLRVWRQAFDTCHPFVAFLRHIKLHSVDPAKRKKRYVQRYVPDF